MKKDSPIERIWNGIYKENPTFCLILGMCPTLATTTSAINGLGMGMSTLIVLCLAELIIALIRNVIPNRMRMPGYIVVIASFVTMIDFLMAGFTPGLYKSLGIYIPLIVVNCIIMGRAEAYAGKMKPVSAFFDGIGMGLGFTLALFLLGSVREIIGAGTWLGMKITPASYVPINIFVLAPGAFLVLAWLVAIMNRLKIGAGRRPEVDPTRGPVCGDCMHCMKYGTSVCSGRTEAEIKAKAEAEAKAKAEAEAKAKAIAEAKAKAAAAAKAKAEAAAMEKPPVPTAENMKEEV